MIDNAGSTGDVNPEQSVGRHPINSCKQTGMKPVRLLGTFHSKCGRLASTLLHLKKLTFFFFIKKISTEYRGATLAGQTAHCLIGFRCLFAENRVPCHFKGVSALLKPLPPLFLLHPVLELLLAFYDCRPLRIDTLRSSNICANVTCCVGLNFFFFFRYFVLNYVLSNWLKSLVLDYCHWEILLFFVRISLRKISRKKALTSLQKKKRRWLPLLVARKQACNFF